MLHSVSAWSRSTALRVMGACLFSLSLVTATLSPPVPAGASMLQSPQQPEDVRTLMAEAPIVRELSGGQTHSYQIILGAGQYLRIVLAPRGIDIRPELFAPDSQKVIGVYSFPTSTGQRTISLIAEVSGSYRLTLRPLRNDAKAGRYEVKIEALHQATEQDKLRIAAESAELEGIRARDETVEKMRLRTAKIEEALSLWRQLGDRQGELRTLTIIGNRYRRIGEPLTAMKLYQEAVRIAHELGDSYQEANLLLSFGHVHNDEGNYQAALETYDRAKRIFESQSRRYGAAIAMMSIGATYRLLGETQRSLEYYQQALPAFSSLNDIDNECNSLNGMGDIYQRMGQMRQALDFHNRALALARKYRAVTTEALTLGFIGDVYLNLGERQKALESFTERLKLCRAVGNRVGEATTLGLLGNLSWLSGENKEALDFLGQALNLLRLSGDRLREATALHGLAQANYSIGNLEEARKRIEESLEITESSRANVVSQRLRESFFASAQSSFALYIDLLMQLSRKHPAEGHDATALGANERARARGLLDLLSESGADLRQGVAPELLQLERSLQRQINAKAAARARLFEDKSAEAQAASFDQEISELTSRYHEVAAQIRAASPRYAALTQPQPLSAAEIQRQLLDENTVLLEFALGEKRSWLWAVTRDSLASHELPPRAEIEAAARKVYESLVARQPKRELSESQQQTLIAEADAKFQKEAAAMSRMLFGNIAAKLRQEWKGKRLAIVASGALEYVPFASLPLPENGENANPQSAIRNPQSSQPLIAEHEVVHLPSASALAVIRRESAGRPAAMKTLAALADPVFEAGDPRLAMAKKKAASDGLIANVRSAESTVASPTINSELSRSVRSFDLSTWRNGFSRLPFSREEVETIAAFVPKNSLLKATGFGANRAVATGGELGRYRIVHFATHGLLNSDHPELSGLVLSLLDENGNPQDGFLRMHEIYNLQLPADLVVLSACQTALGKEIKGEGLVGLTRGFMHAGAERVVASLWQVDDLATAELMKRFYRGMLKDGMRPAAALRAAQLEMMKQKRWAAPYFWAAFTMQGEWR
jgi:CHAT domain-containing protein/tetratricopeptide (TPR) repeat protein